MKIAHYIGTHANDKLNVRLGWYLTRVSQKGAFKQVTHCEAILDENADGSVTIASSSVRDGGVRIKRNVMLAPANWVITDVPSFDTERARRFFEAHAGEPYDMRGAIATVLPGTQSTDSWFCNECVGASVGLQEPHTFTPSQFAAICMTLRALTASPQ